MDEIANYSESVFEDIKHVNEYSQEFWCARELQIALEYKQWRRFQNVIEKAKESCINSGNSVEDHFADVGKIVEAGAASKDIGDIQLSRYACYLIVMNGDPRKEVIALGQTYFAVKTRQQELIEDYDNLSEDRKRLAIRKEMAEHNKLLVAAAKDAGVESNLDYAIFQNYGYQGIYCGLFIEMKYGNNRQQDTQKEFLADMAAAGHFVATCYSAEEAVKVIEEYCKLMNHKMGDIEIVIPLENREALRNITMSIPNNSILKDGKVKGGRS